jgi:hypothetical protein
LADRTFVALNTVICLEQGVVAMTGGMTVLTVTGPQLPTIDSMGTYIDRSEKFTILVSLANEQNPVVPRYPDTIAIIPA